MDKDGQLNQSVTTDQEHSSPLNSSMERLNRSVKDDCDVHNKTHDTDEKVDRSAPKESGKDATVDPSHDETIAAPVLRGGDGVAVWPYSSAETKSVTKMVCCLPHIFCTVDSATLHEFSNLLQHNRMILPSRRSKSNSLQHNRMIATSLNHYSMIE